MPAPLPDRIAVLGAGTSGLAAATAIKAAGATPTLFDERQVEGAAPMASFDPAIFDLVVTSPGLAPTCPSHEAARAAGREIISEVELAWRLRARPDAPWLAVTGTNGKTTTVQLLEAMVRSGGEEVVAAGNVGLPIVQAATDHSYDVFAVELSSFQLHYTSSLAAQAAAILNIAPDHLDWHGSIAAYAADKGRVFAGARVRVFNTEDERTARLAAARPRARAIGFTTKEPDAGQLGVVAGALVDRAFAPGLGREIATFADLASFTGDSQRPARHHLANTLAATALALAHGVEPDAIRSALRTFTLGAHRLQLVRELAGVRYVNDSKATNGHAADAALGSIPDGHTVWIAGGLAKGAQFDELIERRAAKLRAVVLIGVDPEPLAGALARHAAEIPVHRIEPGDTGGVMDQAVVTARTLARPGDTVLLAPACASMDQFTSYAYRGQAFADAVGALEA